MKTVRFALSGIVALAIWLIAVPAHALTFTASTPTISGIARTGEVLTADPGTWSPETPATLTVAWYRSSSSTAIASGLTYTVQPADVGRTITIKVTGSRTGYTTLTTTSLATAPVVSGILTAPIPALSGTPKVGAPFVADPGTWGPAPVTLTYQWFKGTTAITGATAATYTPVVADLGGLLKVSVRGTKTGYTTVTQTSAVSAPVGAGTFTAPTPTITGVVQVGNSVSVSTGTWTPSASLTYQWLRNSAVISGATASSYALVAADQGKTLSVRVTGSRTGYTTTAVESVGTTVGAGTFTSAPTPTVSGTTSTGSTLTASPGTWSPTPTLGYAWTRNGTPIAGASGRTYVLVAADRGTTVRVEVTGTLAGYTSVTRASAGTAIPTIAFTTRGSVSVSGTAMVGSTLTANPSGWAPTPSGYAYQWKANGTNIAGATESTYAPTASELGKTITVTATAKLAGYTDSAATSGATASVVAGAISGSISVTGDAAVGETLTADTSLVSPSPDTASYQWYRTTDAGSSAIGSDSSTYVVTVDDLDATIHVVVTAAAAGYTGNTFTASETTAVVKGDMSGTVAIDGTAQVGRTLSADLHGFPVGATFGYEWQADGTAIDGATGSSYVVPVVDLDKAISLKVTASLSGYNDQTETSQATAAVVAGSFADGAAVDILGHAQVGRTLTADPYGFTPTPTSFEYQWQADGADIAGATSSTYTLTAGEFGAVITVEVVGVLDGYSGTAVTSAATGEVTGAEFVTVGTASISGPGRVGKTLTANSTGWSPTPTSFTYQWFRRDALGVVTAIEGATNRTYTIVASDSKQQLYVVITGQLVGYSDATTAPSGVVRVK